MQRLRTDAPAQATARNTSPHPRDRTGPEPKQSSCPFTPRKKRRTCSSGSAMLQGGAQELNAGLGPPASREWFESRTGACTGDPEASLSPGPDPGPSSPKPGPGMCLGEGHAGRDAASREGEGTRSEAKVMSLFGAPLGIKGPTLTTAGGSGAGCPGVASLLSTCPVCERTTVPELPIHIQVWAILNRERKAQSWGWGGAHRPRPRAPRGAGWETYH